MAWARAACLAAWLDYLEAEDERVGEHVEVVGGGTVGLLRCMSSWTNMQAAFPGVEDCVQCFFFFSQDNARSSLLRWHLVSGS